MQLPASTRRSFGGLGIKTHSAILQATFLLMLLLLGGCSSASPPPPRQALASPSPTAPLPTATPTPTVPVPGPVPANCPVTNVKPQQHFSQLAPVIGASPVWVTWSAGLAIFHFGERGAYTAPYGWIPTKTVWEVGPAYSQQISVQGQDIFDHTPMMLQFLDDTPTANAILAPHHPDHPYSAVGHEWAEGGSYLVIPKAGCYRMQVTWPGGHWEITFAAGL